MCDLLQTDLRLAELVPRVYLLPAPFIAPLQWACLATLILPWSGQMEQALCQVHMSCHAIFLKMRVSLKFLCDVQGWKAIPSEQTSFFAAVNLPLLDFNSCTGPEADFDTG